MSTMVMRFGHNDNSICHVNISGGFRFSQTCKEIVSRLENIFHHLLKVLRELFERNLLIKLLNLLSNVHDMYAVTVF